ncbi:HAD family hydrolase [Candidatus Methylomirabilis sp.]|uniref:HAD family hydrolase n=1 Tax=Candidatus Methylomirabilis sp. TaxID=2032687 RepID=UPI002A6910AB|nr:HAD family hydrolase [Candidatus Methylomirabilis sp.]
MAAESQTIASSWRCVEPPKAVLFDFGGTLDADGITWKDRFYPLYLAEHVEVDWDRYERAYYVGDDALVARRLSSCSFRESLLLQITGVLEALDVADSGLASRLCDRFLQDSLDKIRSNLAILQELSARFRLGIISNFYGNLERVCLESGLAPLMSVLVDSACVGFIKPDPRIFQIALTQLQLDPREAVFVGDSLPRDMEGAKRLGMPHIWLVSDHSGPLAPCCPDDPTIRSLTDLREALL